MGPADGAGGRSRAGGSGGGREPPDLDFNRILARLIRYFHQPKEYWLDHATLHDWFAIYSRELVEAPPAEAFLASYFEYQAPADADGPVEEVELPELGDL